MRPSTFFAAAVTVLVIAAIVGGMVVIGSPWEARRLRLDEQRVHHLQVISSAAEQHAAAYGELPATLDELQRPPQRFPIPTGDPVSGEPYEYQVTGTSTYELCAHFDSASEAGARMRGLWEHPAGRHCFALEVPPEPRHNP